MTEEIMSEDDMRILDYGGNPPSLKGKTVEECRKQSKFYNAFYKTQYNTWRCVSGADTLSDAHKEVDKWWKNHPKLERIATVKTGDRYAIDILWQDRELIRHGEI